MSDLLKVLNARCQIPSYKLFREITTLSIVTEVHESLILDSPTQQTKPAKIILLNSTSD